MSSHPPQSTASTAPLNGSLCSGEFLKVAPLEDVVKCDMPKRNVVGTVLYEVSLRAANDRPYLRRHMCIILDSMKKIRRGDHWSPVERENRKDVEPPPQSTALTAHLNGSLCSGEYLKVAPLEDVS